MTQSGSKRAKTRLQIGLDLLGVCLAVAGVALLSIPAAFIVAGFAFILLSVVLDGAAE